MFKHVITVVPVSLTVSLAQTAHSDHWIRMHSDPYGSTHINSNTIKKVRGKKDIVEYHYRYIYRFGEPSLDIPPNGYQQSVQQMNCIENTYAVLKSQYFKSNGKVDALDSVSTDVHFQPINEYYTDYMKIKRYVCSLL